MTPKPHTRTPRILALTLVAAAAGIAGWGAVAFSELSAPGDRCVAATPELYVNDPRHGVTGDGPAGTALNAFEPGVSFTCGAPGDSWTLTLAGDQQNESTVVGDITYSGDDTARPADAVHVTVLDADGQRHATVASTTDDFERDETSTVSYTARGVKTISKFAVDVDGAPTAWVAVYVQADGTVTSGR